MPALGCLWWALWIVEETGVMNGRFVCPQNSSDILTTSVLEWGGGALERYLGQQGRDLMSGISVKALKEVAESCLPLLLCWGQREVGKRAAGRALTSTQPPQPTALGLSFSRNVRWTFVVYNHLLHWTLLLGPLRQHGNRQLQPWAVTSQRGRTPGKNRCT